MKGVRYITDEDGRKTALIIELEKLKELKSGEDFIEELEDTLDIILREDEPAKSWSYVKEKLYAQV